MPLVDAVERMVDITFIRSKIVGTPDKRGHIYMHTYIQHSVLTHYLFTISDIWRSEEEGFYRDGVGEGVLLVLS